MPTVNIKENEYSNEVISNDMILKDKIIELEKTDKELFNYINSCHDENKKLIEQLLIKQNDLEYDIENLSKYFILMLIIILAALLFGIHMIVNG